MKIENWVKAWCHSLPRRMYAQLCFISGLLTWNVSGHATISGDGGILIVSNLIDGVDTYAIPPQELLRSFRHPINSNVPLLVSFVMDSSLIVVGSDDGCPRIYDHHTGHLSMSLPHGNGTFFPAALLFFNLICARFGPNCWCTRCHSLPHSSYLNCTRQYQTTENLSLQQEHLILMTLRSKSGHRPRYSIRILSAARLC